MNPLGFKYNNGELCCDEIPISKIVKNHKTPLYIYSSNNLISSYKKLKEEVNNLDVDILFALKSNSTIGIVKLLAEQGAGADIVSGGELKIAQASKIQPSKIVFSGVGKTEEEIKNGIASKIRQFNVESQSELDKIISIANNLNTKVPVSLRINPDIEVDTHKKIATGSNSTKFGLPIDQAISLYQRINIEKNIKPMGLAIHIGSQIFNNLEFKTAYQSLLRVANNLREKGCKVPNLDLGGGVGVNYENFEVDFTGFGKTIYEIFKGQGYSLSIEPGRCLVANSGILIAKTIYLKRNNKKNFIIVDAAMNDFIRPTLYEANHKIALVKSSSVEKEKFDIVGPICETGDYFTKDIILPSPHENDLIVIFSVGAYGSVMSSNYNSRPPASEVMIQNQKIQLLKNSQSIEEKIKSEISHLIG